MAYITDDSYINSVIAEANAKYGKTEGADADAFTRELQSRLARFDSGKMADSMDRLASAFPGTDIASQLVGSFESSASFFLEIDNATSIAISPDVLEQLGENDSMFNNVKNMISSLFSAGEQQSLMPQAQGSAVSTRSVVIEMTEARYVEVQRDENGRATSMASLRLQTQQIVADQMQKLFESLGGGQGTRRSGNQGFLDFLTGSASMSASTEAGWEFEGMIMVGRQSSQQMLEDNKRLVGQMDVIIQMWEESGTSADLFTYMQVMGLSDPLVFDLGGDGVNLTGVEDGAYFDIRGDGSKPRTGWIRGDDAFLYLDETGNGVADDANELFGDTGGYANGFDKLAAHDENGDGVIDAQDSVYDRLRLWRDANGDGVNQLEESLTLAEAGIASIGLGYEKKYEKDKHGNVLGERSSFTRTDGSQGQVVDAWLRQA